ncbi:DUF3231 family protein [Brevibacillus brevis]|nr:DUF3231 family protein [Brevibacillus brevis]
MEIHEQMHSGEVFGVWKYLSVTKSLLPTYQKLLNHTDEKDLRKFVEDLIGTMKQEIEQADQLLKVNGIGLPPSSPESSTTNSESIPINARFSTSEIASGLSINIATDLSTCSLIMGQSSREDIFEMFNKFHMEKAQYGERLLRMNKEKGWIAPPPPLHVTTSEPVDA